MTVLAVLAAVFGVIGSAANIPQIYKIFSRKSAKDISVATYLILVPSVIVWILYGIEIQSVPVILTNAVAGSCFVSIIFGWYLYGR